MVEPRKIEISTRIELVISYLLGRRFNQLNQKTLHVIKAMAKGQWQREGIAHWITRMPTEQKIPDSMIVDLLVSSLLPNSLNTEGNIVFIHIP